MSNDRHEDIIVVDNGKSSEVHDHDHKGLDPHAHSTNGSWGQARPLTTNEKYAHEEFKKYDVKDGKVTKK